MDNRFFIIQYRMNPSKVNIGLIRPKSPTNVGAVMRAAGCYNADAVFYTGSRYDRAAKFQTDTHKSNQSIPLTGVTNLLNCIPEGAKLVCIELAVGATPLPEFQHPESAMYLFGPEDGTIEQGIIDKADATVYIPTIGCMNLAATVNVVLYDRLAKSKKTIGSDDLIRHSRDANNRVEIR